MAWAFTGRREPVKLYWTGACAVGNANIHSPVMSDRREDARTSPTASEAERLASLWGGLTRLHLEEID